MALVDSVSLFEWFIYKDRVIALYMRLSSLSFYMKCIIWLI